MKRTVISVVDSDNTGDGYSFITDGEVSMHIVDKKIEFNSTSVIEFEPKNKSPFSNLPFDVFTGLPHCEFAGDRSK